MLDVTSAADKPSPEKFIERIADALWRLIEEDSVFELRGLNCIASGFSRPHDRGGFFHWSKIPEAARAAYHMSAVMKATGVYFTKNPLKPDVISRRCNRVDFLKKGEATSDSDVLKRRLFLVDCDPIRTRDVSSTDSEKAAALMKAVEIRDHLHGRGWPDPYLCDSGNGWHLLYKVDQPNDDKATKLFKQCLRALHAKFSDDAVSIDTSVFNASRICKLYGTMARKGDSTEDRPHRMARVVKGPAE
jgi:hypothetical protein